MAATLIKKYGNRRLYDTGESRYVTLDELAAKVRSGIDTRVVDAQTGEDLTQATLTQIVLETGHAAKFLPVQLLTQMIRLSDDSLAEFFSRYVTSALDVYLQAKRGAQTLAQYNPLMWMANVGNPYARAVRAAVVRERPAEPRCPRTRPLLRHRRRRPSPSRRWRADAASAASAMGDDVASMRRELDELKQAIREGLAPRGGKTEEAQVIPNHRAENRSSGLIHRKDRFVVATQHEGALTVRP